jgi:hypothetical protein
MTAGSGVIAGVSTDVSGSSAGKDCISAAGMFCAAALRANLLARRSAARRMDLGVIASSFSFSFAQHGFAACAYLPNEKAHASVEADARACWRVAGQRPKTDHENKRSLRRLLKSVGSSLKIFFEICERMSAFAVIRLDW